MKLRTVKAISKRFKITKTKKVVRRAAGQDHFNAAERSKVTRAKRKDTGITAANARSIKKAIPYK